MRSRALFAAVILSCAIVSGGWLVTRGMVGTRAARGDNAAMFGQVYQRIARQYVDTLSDSALVTRTIDGLVEELHDPHSAYLSPQLLSRLSERTTGRYAGVGAQVDLRDGWITIVAPLPGGPARAAGVQAGDRILTVDGRSMRDDPIDEAQKLLRGAPGSKVTMTVERPGVPAPMEFVLSHLPLVPEIAEALVGGRGPFGPLLEQIYAWEAGELTGVNAQPQRIQRMAAIYLEATQFADQVFSHAEARPS